MTTPHWTLKIAAAIARGKREIAADVAAGTVPADVATFAALHDYVDANEYGGLCEDGWIEYVDLGTDLEWSPATNDAINAVQDALHAWLVAGRPTDVAQVPCDVCAAGRPAGYASCPACGRL